MSTKSRVDEIRSAANKIRRITGSDGFQSRTYELETLIATQERRHRKFCGGSSRYALSVPVSVDYFLVRVFAWAADTCSRRSSKSMINRIAGTRTDYLIALSIYSDERARSAFRSAGLTRAELARLSEVVDYCADIAGDR